MTFISMGGELYLYFKLKDNFFEIVENNEDPAIEKICENILKEKQAFLN